MTFYAAFYKGTPPGVRGIYNRGIQRWTNSPYSHVELLFSDGLAASASWMDRGVRFKRIDFAPDRWDLVALPHHLEPGAWAWFDVHKGEKYDVLGNLQFVLACFDNAEHRWFCSEACAAALGLPDPWRYDPATLASALTLIQQPASAGFLLPEKFVQTSAR
ncbi:MAG: hypothetical protein K2X55_27420 [Burkholderiaceae bacterium]|nr:hypothetical protein [Burkholderiaceae bacterium]